MHPLVGLETWDRERAVRSRRARVLKLPSVVWLSAIPTKVPEPLLGHPPASALCSQAERALKGKWDEDTIANTLLVCPLVHLTESAHT